MRRFEYLDDKSAKFWEIEQSERDLTIRWGRIGTAGQNQTKNFADAAKAGAVMTKLIGEKTGKGYAEVGAAAGAAIGTALPKAAAVKPAPAVPATGETPPAETVDQQIDRVFEAIRAQIADDAVDPAEIALTAARIRRVHGIGELAASEVHKLLERAGLTRVWSSGLAPNARTTAIAMAADIQAAPAAPAIDPPDGAAPWLAEGEPLRIDGPADHTRSFALATRRNPKPVSAVDPQAAWDELRPSIRAGVSADFDNSDPALRVAFEQAWRGTDVPTLGGTPQTDAILLALATGRHGYDRINFGELCVDYLVARHGLPYVVEAQIASMHYRVDEHYASKLVTINYRAGSGAPHYHTDPMTAGQWHLRRHLASAPQDIYDACAAIAEQATTALEPECQVALALMFPDLPDMSHALIERLCASGAEPVPAVHWLQLTATSDTALAKARKAESDHYIKFWDRHNVVATVLLEHRLDAVRWLAPGGAYDHAGDALTCIGTPEALEALARVAASAKRALARFTLAAQRWPVAATVALARHLARNVKDQGLLMPTLVDLVRTHPALPDTLQPWLEPASNTLLDSIRARLAGPQQVAAPEDLPPVLADAPWLRPKKKAAASLQLSILPLAPVEQWDDDEKAEILAPSPWHDRYRDAATSHEKMASLLGFGRDKELTAHAASLEAGRAALAQGGLPELLAAWRGLLAEKKKERYFHYYLDGQALTHLSPELGIPFWNTAASEASCSGVDYVAATWGLPALPGVLAHIAGAPNDYLGIALHFGAVELAPLAARAFAKLKTLRPLGREWLRRFPEHAACALIAPALGKPNEARDCAAASLRYLAGIGHQALIEEVAGRYGQAEVLPALHAMLGESPLDRYPNKRAALPEFWKPDGWRRPHLVDGKALPDEALAVVGTMMSFPAAEEVYAGLHQVKGACTAESLADFAWDVFSAWLNASAPSKEAWALANLGVFGNDDTARRLTPYIRAWPGEAAHARAVAGLDVLAAIGSDVALMLLNGIAQKIKFKGLQDRAREKILAVAEARGLSPEELEDRLAPDLGLDQQGSMLLDFGPRAFKVGFDEALKPYAQEWLDGKAGARLPDLPKPKKTDDEALAGPASERFKLLKKDARTIASQQVLRLELAMCARRRWSTEVFAQFIANHPLVRHLVRRLVWGVYEMPLAAAGDDGDEEVRVASYGGVLLDCFRVSEDGEYTTAADDPYSLPGGERIAIGLPHALELPASVAAEFGQLLADYELLQPFAQLGRDTHALTEQEHAASKLLRWKGIKVKTGKVLGLANNGWRRGSAQDSGCIWTYDKPADAGHTLELTLEPGIFVGMVDENPEQTLGEVTLGRPYRSGWGRDEELSQLGALDPIAASELIRDMERLRS